MKRKVIKPIINQYKNKELGICSRGCRCHTISNIEVGDGEIVNSENITSDPYFEVSLENFWGKHLVEEINGQLVWKDNNNSGIMLLSEFGNDIDSGIVGGTYKKDNIWYIKDPCGGYPDSFECSLEEIDVTELKDGEYKTLIEIGCWIEHRQEYGDEGECESKSQIIYDYDIVEGQIEIDCEATGNLGEGEIR